MLVWQTLHQLSRLPSPVSYFILECVGKFEKQIYVKNVKVKQPLACHRPCVKEITQVAV